MQEGAAWPEVNAAAICGSFELGTSIARPEGVTPRATAAVGSWPALTCCRQGKTARAGLWGWCQQVKDGAGGAAMYTTAMRGPGPTPQGFDRAPG